MSSLKKLAGQTAVYGLSSILGRFLNYLLTPIYTYQFAPHLFGVVTELYAYVAFFVVLLTMGLESAYFRFAKEVDHQKVYATAFKAVSIVSLAFIFFSVLFSQPIANTLHYADNREYIIWFAIILGIDSITAIPLAQLRHSNKAFQFAMINLSNIGVNLGINIFFIYYCKPIYDNQITDHFFYGYYQPEIGIGYIFIANLCASAVRLILLTPSWLNALKGWDRTLLSKMQKFGFPLMIAGFAGIINETLDRILLKYLLIPTMGETAAMAQVGIYGACYKVAIFITLIVQAYRYAAEPFFFATAKEKNAKQTYANVMSAFVLLCCLSYLLLLVNIDLIMLFVGKEYRVGVKVVPLLLLANIFLGIQYNLSVWYKLSDKTNYGAYIAIFGAVFTVVANLLLIPSLGYVGAAWATLSCYITMSVVSYYYGQKYYQIPYPIIKLAALLIASVVLGYLSLYFNSHNTIIQVTKNALWLVTAIIFIVSFKELYNKKEIEVSK